MSGHLFFKDRYFGFDDGIYGMLRILGLAVNARTSLTKLFAELPLAHTMPEQRIACDNRQSIIKAAHKLAACIPNARLITTDGIRIECAYGWMLIRPAKTRTSIEHTLRRSNSPGSGRDEKTAIKITQPAAPANACVMSSCVYREGIFLPGIGSKPGSR